MIDIIQDMVRIILQVAIMFVKEIMGQFRDNLAGSEKAVTPEQGTGLFSDEEIIKLLMVIEMVPGM